MIGKVRKFFSEVVIELKKVSWSSRSEVIDATWIILFSAIFVGLYIALSDFILSKFLGLIIR
ncbi:MAG: preprotein translocase subunit SecE [Candidatus Omnitrophica bacterium]|nr:preprotein translocase subunit SecE [Candidatus Omnitrophota bacterium]